jgi:hypothetical protein
VDATFAHGSKRLLAPCGIAKDCPAKAKKAMAATIIILAIVVGTLGYTKLARSVELRMQGGY